MEESDLEPVLEWRNAPTTRQFMYTRHEISLDEHRQWFERMTESASDHLLILELDGAPQGFLRLHIESEESGRAQWGFFRAPAAPRGTGTVLCERSLAYAFEDLELHKIYGEVLEVNVPSQRLHSKLGFTKEAHLRDHYHDGQRYWDAIGFGLLASEWDQGRGA
ncbi:UDP-4-amino-4,6-dideoxy-N-acetyl-beta-L-altrosamine N-acetyltransferase [Nesterenkonia sp. MY13]|uniref:UDP-4-amino-4, 6-dideoxy-N-acetyl-beta-L-altrosamine N-acetyltransferase n=2 Tax=Nesterenkonia sedimenti TaxID=1463632 RepID=A0A7X8YEQ5_9MICC|nr:UDP-4-amino-4,6-dideoxy-N-acetyl-beta-L-altrosamine N-acetyltransferase [Nesterenkonia sedimenti]